MVRVRTSLLALAAAALASCGPGTADLGGGSGAGGGGTGGAGGGSAGSGSGAGGSGGALGAGGSGGTGGNASGGGAGGSAGAGGGAGAKDAGIAIDPNAFWANDPPPQWCGPDGGSTPPQTPGGTPECPDDKNRQGCACPTVGAQAPCWPGLRVNRSLGQCRDGVTTCTSLGELGAAWGPCQGYVLPTAGVTKGAGACRCFSAGQWALTNLSPCFISSNGSVIGAVSTWVDNTGVSRCPSSVTNPPSPQPGTTFTANTLNVDCAGHFKLCYELKAGTASAPKATDCSVVKVCTEADYTAVGQPQRFPDLPSWTSTSTACAAQFASTGGYGEMSVVGKSVRCDAIDDGSGAALVFNRVQYCSLSCNTNPTGPGCSGCGQGGSGSF